MGIFQQFPYSNFHEFNLDQIIKIMREMQDEWENTKSEWASYKDFIDNYFANLDLSEETYQVILRMAGNGELNDVIDPTVVAAVAEWLQNNIGPTTPAIDKSLKVAGAGADSEIVGNYVFPTEYNSNYDVYVEPDPAQGYWDSGVWTPNASWRGTRTMIPVKPGQLWFANVECRASCEDIDKTHVTTITLRTIASLPGGFKLTVIPANTYYIGVYTNDTSITEIRLTKLNSANLENIEYPYISPEYLLISNAFVTGEGTINANNNFNSIVTAGLPAGSKFYVNNNASINCVCMNNAGSALTPTKVFDPYSNGNIYTIPAGTCITYFCIYKARVDETGTKNVDYVSKITQSKKILTIGDSITWLDGVSQGGIPIIAGYQKELRQLGYEVDKRGFSGHPFTAGVNTGDPTACLYNDVVTDQLDVANYEYIIVEGGLNDMLYSAPIGTPPDTYTDTGYTGTTMCGAISAILEYIRDNNSDAKILLVVPPKSEAVTRPYTTAKSYNAAIKECGQFWSCAMVDWFEDMNVSPDHNFNTYFYDVTHPNIAGLRMMGKLVANKIRTLYDHIA